tara:strand:+ start:223 stop:1755 length:1533 start_codon:yes stop_codon:yes gene_type:complete
MASQVKEQQFLNDLRRDEKELLGQSHDISQKMLKTSFEINKLHQDDDELQRRITKSTGEEREFYVKKRKEVLATIAAKRIEQDQSRNMVELVEMEYKKRVLLNKVLAKNGEQVQGFLDKTKNIGDSIEGAIKKIPFFGDFLVDKLGLKDFGDQLKGTMLKGLQRGLAQGQGFTSSMQRGLKGVSFQLKAVGRALMTALGPIGMIIAGFTALFMIVRNVRNMQRKFAQDTGIARDQVGLLAVKTKAAAAGFNAIGLDGSKIQGTLKEIVNEFGSLENMTVANAANIEKFAQNAGVSSSEVVKLNKVFMDLDGLSFDAATNVSKVAADLAKAAGVSTNKVIGDMSSSAEKFAKFSMDGAEGFAKAAVEAAKVGSSLSGILSAADGLLKLETSISAQFEAQVLTGKQINLERARQLALDGDIAGLTTEIQSVVGQVGDIQSLNVIQRQSVADAIGISVQDLLKISRGEQVAGRETVLDEQKKTNQILNKVYEVELEGLDVAKDKNVNVNQSLY